jgi:ABC-type proline/glycine betaine transport system substrate-binding protein
MPTTSNLEPRRRGRDLALAATFLLGAAQTTGHAAEATTATPIKLAVFDFELEDASPTAVLQGQTLSNADEDMRKVTSAARTALAQSGRYVLVDVSKADAKAATEKSLRKCNGCEADIAQHLGAEQSLLGVVIRATATDYYLLIQIRDARTGKVLDQESANFAGSEEGWPSGVRMLIKHQVLVTPP